MTRPVTIRLARHHQGQLDVVRKYYEARYPDLPAPSTSDLIRHAIYLASRACEQVEVTGTNRSDQ